MVSVGAPTGLALGSARWCHTGMGRLQRDRSSMCRIADGQVNPMHRRIRRLPGLPLGGGLDLLLVAGAAYFAWEHEQGRHGRPHLLCPICWVSKVAPAPEASGSSGPAEPTEPA